MTLLSHESQADLEALDRLQEIATREGLQFQAVLGDAMRDYLTHKRLQSTRRYVLEAFQVSLRQRDELYRLLAK